MTSGAKALLISGRFIAALKSAAPPKGIQRQKPRVSGVATAPFDFAQGRLLEAVPFHDEPSSIHGTADVEGLKKPSYARLDSRGGCPHVTLL